MKSTAASDELELLLSSCNMKTSPTPLRKQFTNPSEGIYYITISNINMIWSYFQMEVV